MKAKGRENAMSRGKKINESLLNIAGQLAQERFN